MKSTYVIGGVNFRITELHLRCLCRPLSVLKGSDSLGQKQIFVPSLKLSRLRRPVPNTRPNLELRTYCDDPSGAEEWERIKPERTEVSVILD